MSDSIPYLPGCPLSRPRALARYLPPNLRGVITSWLGTHLPPKKVSSEHSEEEDSPWVLDPFGADPLLAVETAQAGYRVLVTANNPVARFLLEMETNRPTQAELRAALADLASTRKGDERLEPHIRSLYLTRCEQCDVEVMAEAFIWDRGTPAAESPVPIARIYHCPNCGESGEKPATDEDIARAAQFTAGGLHRARALERVASRDDPDRSHVEEALATYLPRAVYALFTLINKLDSLSTLPSNPVIGSAPVQSGGKRRQFLEALLLTAFDQANTLWPYPSGRSRPKQLTIPPRFREKNIWLALEEAIDQWADPEGQGEVEKIVPLTFWPDLPPREGGICLFEGRLKDLVDLIRNDQPARIQVGAVLAALPRPNQAFWTLSALWAGWLWGREAVGPFKSVLRRRRYDWNWHCNALHSALEHLYPILLPGTPLFGLIGEVEPGFLSAGIIASELAEFDLEGMALRPESSQAQILWLRGNRDNVIAAGNPKLPVSTPVQLAALAAQDYLRERGEPASYLQIHAAALIGLVHAGELRNQQAADSSSPHSPAETLSRVNDILEEAFSYRRGFLRYGGSEKSPEAGQWWLREVGGDQPDTVPAVLPPLADRVEMVLVRRLLKKPGSNLLEIDSALCAAFPGLLTPDPELIQVCLDSYGEERPPESGKWFQREQDSPKARKADLQTIFQILKKIARDLGYQVEGRAPLLWYGAEGDLKYAWYVVASAVIGEVLEANHHPPQVSLIALPDERSNLLAYKLDRNRYLRQLIDEGWRFINLRQLRWLSEHPSLSLETLEEQLTDRLTEYSAPQMRLL